MASKRPDDKAGNTRGLALPSKPPFLTGAWSTIYSNYSHPTDPAAPIQPGITLGIFRFDAANGVSGELRPNLRGRVNSVIQFDGKFNIFRDEPSGLLQGVIEINLTGAGGTSKNPIFYVVRDSDELDWVLLGSDDPARRVVAGGKLFRIKPVPFKPPKESGPAIDGADKGPVKQ